MKKIISILAIILYCLNAAAQVDRNAGSLSLPGYNGTATISIKGDIAEVQNAERTERFSIGRNGSAISLTDTTDASRIYEALKLEAKQLETALSDQAGSDAISKLLDIASKMNNQRLIIRSNEPGGEQAIEEGAQPAPLVEETSDNTWLFPVVVGVAALILGVLIGRAMKKNTPAPELKRTLPIDNTITEGITKIEKGSDPKLEQLHKELAAAKEKIKLISEKNQQLIEGDNLYYNSVFERILLPLQNALDNGNEAEIVKYLSLSMAHLSSITRVKIKKKQKYDDANIQLIFGNTDLSREFPTIDGQTPIDKIPANLRTLIQVLQKSGVSSLDESVVKGYKIKQL